MFCRELKVEIKVRAVRGNHASETAALEMTALVLARARMEATRVGKEEVLRISFGKMLVAWMVPLWRLVQGCRGM